MSHKKQAAGWIWPMGPSLQTSANSCLSRCGPQTSDMDNAWGPIRNIES